MLFNSVDFFLLLAITCLLYWRSSTVFWRQNWLLLASLIFYAYWFWPYLLLFFGLSAIAYLGGFQIAKGRRHALRFVVILLLAVLGVFKYTQFSFNLFNQTSAGLGARAALPEVNILVPLGISFICFQLIGYLVDVAKQKIPPERSFRVFTLFIGFFPQLVAGPICRAEQLIPQLTQKVPFSLERFTGGLLLVAVGLLLKVGFADGLAPFVDSVFSADSYPEQPALLAAICFGVQIFCDFWGYSTMAVGAAVLFGISIPINFYLPYLAPSLREFWRRWHITLSYWFRDYLYIPLGGSRQGQLLTARNLLMTMGLCGLWHGASLNFVVWGLMHGAYLVGERWAITLWQRLWQRLKPQLGPQSKMLASLPINLSVASWLVTMAFVTTTWIFFRARSLSEAIAFTQAAWNFSGAGIERFIDTLSAVPRSVWLLLAAFVIAHVPIQRLIDAIHQNRLHMSWRIVLTGWLLVLAVIMSAGQSFEFIYFEF